MLGPASYRLTAGLCPPDGNEPDDTLPAARSIQPGTPITLNQCDGTTDWLVFQAAAGGRYEISFSSFNPAARPSGRFCDANGSSLPTDRGVLTATASGPVWIEVSPPVTQTLLESEYTLSVVSR